MKFFCCCDKSGLEGLSSCTCMFGLEGLSPIGVWDVLGGGTHDGHEAGYFSSAAKGRGVLSIVITCVGRTMGKE